MTVILGVRCKDGLIIAADSQGTMHDPGNVPVRVDSIKLQKLGNSAILGSSGAQGLTQRVIDGLSGQPHAFSLKRKRADAVKELTKVSNQIQKAAVSEWSGYPDTKPTPGVAFVAAGQTTEGGCTKWRSKAEASTTMSTARPVVDTPSLSWRWPA